MDAHEPDVEKVDLSLLANFVHQVVNPLNGIAGTLDNIIDGTIKDEGRRAQRMNAARAQLEQCISLVRNLAFFAQGFHKIRPNEAKDIRLSEIIIQAAMFFQEDAEEKGIRIELKERVSDNLVKAHRELLIQVLMNIFDNCIKYSAHHSIVEVHQWIQKGSGSAMITIRNKPAIIISQADIDRMCDLGFRGQNATRIVASGTGLGMHISRRIIDQVHGGTLSVQKFGANELEFTIKLPDGR